jgi:hypothetical protein
LFHHFSIWIFAQIHLGYAHQSFFVIGEQEFVILLLAISVERDTYGVVIGESQAYLGGALEAPE